MCFPRDWKNHSIHSSTWLAWIRFLFTLFGHDCNRHILLCTVRSVQSPAKILFVLRPARLRMFAAPNKGRVISRYFLSQQSATTIASRQTIQLIHIAPFINRRLLACSFHGTPHDCSKNRSTYYERSKPDKTNRSTSNTLASMSLSIPDSKKESEKKKEGEDISDEDFNEVRAVNRIVLLFHVADHSQFQ